ncbi:MAG: sialidase family protein [Verrucomicrobiota bacterium]
MLARILPAIFPFFVTSLMDAQITNDPVVEVPQGTAEAFLSTPQFALTSLFGEGAKKVRGGRNIVTAKDGSVLAFHRTKVRRSTDSGIMWSDPIEIGEEAGLGNAIVDEVTGTISLVNPKGHRWVSDDNGLGWTRELITVLPNRIGHGASKDGQLGAAAMQPGVTILFGENEGRLIMPVRWIASNTLPFRPYNYNTAIYSDDRGKTWQTSAPFPVFGTGEGALAELSDGRILYSSREHMNQGNRFFAWSHDGGYRWLNFRRSEILPDGPRGTSYGCMGGLVRLPVKDRDILLYSNLDTERGVLPSNDRAGASQSQGRERITVWASFDGGETWPVKRLVFGGPSSYSSLAVGRPGTASEGSCFLNFEGGKNGMFSEIQLAVFNLSWLLDGKQTGHGKVPEWARGQ